MGNVALYKDIYAPLLMDVITVPSPDCFEREPGESLGRAIRAGMFEPMRAAAGSGMRTKPPR